MCEKIRDKRNVAPQRKTKNAEQALAALMHYAAKAERSSGDAMRLMRRWEVPENERGKVLARLVEMRFIDDNRYAVAYVREKSRLSGWGVHKIRAGLRAKGIDARIIEEALTQLPDKEAGNERLRELLQRKLKGIKGGTPYEVKGKLLRFGLSRGYDYGDVTDVIDTVMRGVSDREDD